MVDEEVDYSKQSQVGEGKTVKNLWPPLPVEEVFLGRRKFGMVRKEEEEKGEEREKRGPFKPF